MRCHSELGDCEALEEIKPAELERIQAERRESDRVTPATVNRELAFLKHVYKVPIRDGKTETNPAARVKLLKEPSGRVRYLTDEEEAALRAVLSPRTA